MKILLLDIGSNLLDFGLRCLAAGHEVKHWQGTERDGKRSKVGQGLLPQVAQWKPHMSWADLIMIPDNGKYMREVDGFIQRGFPVFGPCKQVVEWELDRFRGMEVMQQAGLPVMDCIEFKKIGEAMEFLKAHPNRYVSKPNGDMAKNLSYVSKSARDLMFMLERWQAQGDLQGQKFIFQPFFKGTEVAVGGWMTRDGFIPEMWCESFEHKKLMNGEVGPNTGEMGTAVKYVRESKLADELLRPLEAQLIRAKYVGYIDVAVMVNERGKLCPLEFTSRPGWPLFQIQQALHRGDPAQWMKDALEGSSTLKVSQDVAIGIVLTLPDFPYEQFALEESADFPLYGWERIPPKNFHPVDLKAGEVWDEENGQLSKVEGLLTTGTYVGVISGTGETVHEAHEKAYLHLDRLELPNSPQYRTDIGLKVEKALKLLQPLGYCTEWRWK